MAEQRWKNLEARDRETFSKGAIVMREGDPAFSAYLIQFGKVKVYLKNTEGGTIGLAELGPGDIFGEASLVFEEPRTATVEVIEDCILVPISRDIFHKKLEKSDPTIRAIIPMLLRRLIHTNSILLQNKNDLDDLVSIVNSVYQNVQIALTDPAKAEMQMTVLPKLQNFLDAVVAFKEKQKL